MDVTEKWGDDVDSAVELALEDLKLTRDQVKITVLEEPSRGFFGIGSKLALVRVEKIQEKPAEVQKKPEIQVKPANRQPEKKNFAKEAKKPAPKKAAEPAEAPKSSRLDELDFHKNMDNLPVCEDHPAVEFLKEVTEQMGLKLDMVVRADDNNVYVDIQGADSGTIIGKRGQTLDAIQYLTSLVVNKGHDNYVKVVVDAENYRAKRERTLEQLANKLAGKVVRTKRTVKLEPMNPYERKVIHATLQDNPRVTTRSEGQDPYRRVVIELK
jgi:spoIIIJ-associated protein